MLRKCAVRCLLHWNLASSEYVTRVAREKLFTQSCLSSLRFFAATTRRGKILRRVRPSIRQVQEFCDESGDEQSADAQSDDEPCEEVFIEPCKDKLEDSALKSMLEADTTNDNIIPDVLVNPIPKIVAEDLIGAKEDSVGDVGSGSVLRFGATKAPSIKRKLTAIGEYIYGPNVVFSAMRAESRPHFHRLYLCDSLKAAVLQQSADIGNAENEPVESDGADATVEGRNQHMARTLCALAETLSIPVEFCGKREMNALVGRNLHQGFILDCDTLECPLFDETQDAGIAAMRESLDGRVESDSSSKRVIWLALDGCVNEHNVGSILRSAFFLNAAGVIHPRKGSAPLSALTAHSAAGALDAMASDRLFRSKAPLCDCLRLVSEAFAESETQYKIVGLTVANGEKSGSDSVLSLSEFCTKFPPNLGSSSESPVELVVLVVGNESTGLSPAVAEHCTHLVSIPPVAAERGFHFGIDSLNVATALTTALYSLNYS